MGNNISYTDFPEGTNCITKTYCITRYSAMFGFFLGTLDCINYSKAANIGTALTRYPKFMVPGVTCGVVLGMTTCTLAMIRKKDDRLNYALGGLAAGAMMGAHRRSYTVGVSCAVVGSFLALIYKEMRINGAEFLPEVRPFRSNYETLKYDFSLTSEEQKDLVTCKRPPKTTFIRE